jgi:photosystem II stability/assembly factor-like uncharacterized protein
VGTRNGGVWRTINNGTTFEPIFDDQQALSIRDVAAAPSNPDIIYMAAMANLLSTNEELGVFKTNDGGKTWNKALYTSEKVGGEDVCLFWKP